MTKHEGMSNSEHVVVARLFGLPSSFLIRASSFPPHLPVFDERVRNFFQKTRWPLENIAVAAAQAHVRKGEIKLITRTGNGDVKQAALFFERITGVERASAWEHSVGEPDNEDGVKLQTFGLVNRRKIHRFLVGRLVRRRFCIDIADE